MIGLVHHVLPDFAFLRRHVMEHGAAVLDGPGLNRFHVHAVLIRQVGDVEKAGINADGAGNGRPLRHNMLRRHGDIDASEVCVGIDAGTLRGAVTGFRQTETGAPGRQLGERGGCGFPVVNKE